MRTRRKAQLLAQYLEGVPRRGELPATPVARVEIDAAGLAPLLQVVQRLESAAHPELTPTAQAAGLVRLREGLAQKRSLRTRRPVAVRRLLWAAAALVLALLLTATGTVWAAGDSVPGEVLYPVKRAAEQVRLALTWDPTARSQLLIGYAERRLAELMVLDTAGELYGELLADLEDQTEAAAAEIDEVTEDGRTELLERMVRLTERQQEVLARVLQNAPPAARSGLERALERSQNRHERALRALGRERNQPQTPQDEHTPGPQGAPALTPGPQGRPPRTPGPPEHAPAHGRQTPHP